MSTVLAVDSAGPQIGVALLAAGEVDERVAEGGRGTERQLLGMVEALCAARTVPRSAIDRIAVSIGPGAFTGLRVGIATAGGLAQALDRKVVPVDSLSPRAHQAGLGGELLVMLDARKQRVYAARFRDAMQIDAASDVPPEVAVGWMTSPFRATGAGAVAYRDLVVDAGGTVVDDPLHPGTGHLARLAATRPADAVRPADLVPHYIRAPDAIRRREQR